MIKLLLLFLLPFSTESLQTGLISGVVRDADSRIPFAGALIEIKAHRLQTLSGESGQFRFMVPVGMHQLSCSSPDHETVTKKNVSVRPGQNTILEFLLPLHLKTEVTVKADYLPASRSEEHNQANFSGQELRHSPGSAGDISRVVSSLPSVARINDMINALAVRGGSPGENGFYIDTIPIPDINHYPTPGSTGGPIGMLNVAFIDSVTLYAGAFPSEYGDRLSSVMDIRFREGKRENSQFKVALDLAGFGFIGEGPMLNKSGSWLLSARRSYIDLALKLIGEESGIAPHFSDIQGKLILDLNSQHRLSLLTVNGMDWVGWEKDRAQNIGNNFYGDNKGLQSTVGLGWRWLWPQGSSHSSISLSYSDSLADYKQVRNDSPFMTNDSADVSVHLRHSSDWSLSRTVQLQLGFELQQEKNQFKYFLRGYTDFWGRLQPPARFDKQSTRSRAGLFCSMRLTPGPFTIQAGIRADVNSVSKEWTASPRLALSLKPFSGTTLTAAAGTFHQLLPLLLLNQNPDARTLGALSARHLTLGITQLLPQDLILSLELYHKEYRNLPVDPDQPLFFFIDELIYGGAFFPKAQLSGSGMARSQGIEFSLQKKRAHRLYGLISGSLFRAQYRDGLGQWRNRVFDVRYLLNAEGGYRSERNWAISAQWSLSGGSPYTPFDMALSVPVNAGIFDQTAVNAIRNPALHSLNLRYDHHVSFRASRLTLYLDIWNVYNRKNTGLRYWNSSKRREEVMHSWGILPMLGAEYAF